MKIGIVSDIHSNLEALTVVLAKLRQLGIERIYCLGDVVGYGADPNACVELIRTSCAATVLGNHDAAITGHTDSRYFNSYAQAALRWTRRVITDENLEFLKSLPVRHCADSMMFVHATPGNPTTWSYILHDHEAEPHFEAMQEARVAFIGHSHLPASFRSSDGRRIIVNVGSVGQPRDRNSSAACVVFDTESGTFEWIREVYPVQEAARKIRQANLPEFLAARLFIGM